MEKFFEDVARISHLLFKQRLSNLWIRARVWLAMKLLPKDFSNLLKIIVSKLSDKYETLETEKKAKITSLTIDFEYRD